MPLTLRFSTTITWFSFTIKALADSPAEQDIQGYLEGAKEYKIFLDELKEVYEDEIDLNEADEGWMKEAGWL